MQRLSTLNKLKSAKDIDPQSAKELIVSINLDDISALEQVRSENNVGFSHKEDDDSLVALARSIEANGLKQPIIVRNARVDNNDLSSPIIDNKYIIVCGERRYRASLLLRKWQIEERARGKLIPEDKLVTTIDCIVRNYDSAETIVVDQLTENIQRTELNPFEIASSLKKIEELYIKDNPTSPYIKNGKLSHIYLCELTGKSPMWLSQILAFNDVPLQILSYFKDGVISKSPRTGYDIINAFKKDPETTVNFLERKRLAGVLVDRSFIGELKTLIARRENFQDPKSMPNLEIPKPIIDNERETTGDKNKNFSLTSNSRETVEFNRTQNSGSVSDVFDKLDKSNSFTSEKEDHSSSEKSVSISENNAHTDLDPDNKNDFVDDNDSLIDGLYCSYHGMPCLLLLTEAPSKTEGMLLDRNGRRLKVSLSEITITSFKFKNKFKNMAATDKVLDHYFR